MLRLKTTAATVTGAAGGLVAGWMGGIDQLLYSLLVFMAIDIVTGWLAAAVFKTSFNTETGRLCSMVGFRGLVKKGCMLLMIIVAVQLDGLLSTSSLTRDAVVIAFLANELLSILENMGAMGIRLPDAIVNALELLNRRKSE